MQSKNKVDSDCLSNFRGQFFKYPKKFGNVSLFIVLNNNYLNLIYV